MKKPDGTLGHTVYQKPTHTNRYLNANSHHHPKQIHAVAKTLITRSRRLADNDQRQQELNTIETTLQMNNYSERRTTDKISRILRRHNISTSFVPERTIRSMLRNPKDQIPLESQGVCHDCGRTYIGQTNRRINIRKDEHKLAVEGKVTTSSLFQYVLQTGHNINFDNTAILASNENFYSRTIREAIEIEKRPNNIKKRDDAQRLPST
nr:uncharacterized protein LOC111511257 [Leptinotarsa decemlineata]